MARKCLKATNTKNNCKTRSFDHDDDILLISLTDPLVYGHKHQNIRESNEYNFFKTLNVQYTKDLKP